VDFWVQPYVNDKPTKEKIRIKAVRK